MTVKKGPSFLHIFIIIFTSFVLGYICSFYIDKNNISLLGKTKNTAESIVDTQSVDDKNSLLGSIFRNKVAKDKAMNMDLYWEVYDKIQKNYYHADQIEKKELLESSIRGLVKGLDDQHSEYFTKEGIDEFYEQLNLGFQGIGAVVDEDPRGVKLETILKGSPAKEHDLRAGDIVIKADDTVLAGMDVQEAIKKIKGPAGSKVLLEIYREGEVEILKKEVTRREINIPSVESESIGEDIGYITLNTYGDKTVSEFNEALKVFQKKKGIIIDVRNNGGGLLETATGILSNFLEKGKQIVSLKERNGKQKNYKSNAGEVHFDGKIVVLINENSASASEITAGALRDHKRAIIVGKKSYGKGSVQETLSLSNGGSLKITMANWFTPADISIDKEGITPHIEIDLKKEDYDLESCKKSGKCEQNIENKDFEFYDRQKQEAINILRLLIEQGDIYKTIELFLEQHPEYNKKEELTETQE